ncbi:hypothetical protein M5D96_008812, partial [Drosophila gunungcola]
MITIDWASNRNTLKHSKAIKWWKIIKKEPQAKWTGKNLRINYNFFSNRIARFLCIFSNNNIRGVATKN